MKNVRQDIYGTDRRKRDAQVLSETSREHLFDKPWADAMQRQRRATFILAAITVLIILAITGIAVQQYVGITKQSSSSPAPASARRIVAPPSPLDLNVDVQTQFLMDELSEKPASSIPENGDLPLSVQWVKQAAFYLVQAEKANREERYDDALDSYQKALLIYPNLEGVHRSLGLIYLVKKDYKPAAEMFERVAQEEDMTFGLANNLGVAYLALEDYKRAETNFLIATRLDPKYPLAYFNLATLYMRTSNPTNAAVYFGKYLDLKPDDISAAQSYAMVLVQLQRWERAAELLTAIARATPDVAPIHFRLAEALSHTGKNTPAVESLRRGTALVDARKALSWLSQPEFDLLRNDPGFKQLLSELATTN